MGAKHPQAASEIRARSSELSTHVVDKAYAAQPDVWSKYGPGARVHCERDAGYHLAYLAEALDAGLPDLFVAYAAWVKVLFHRLRLPEHTMPDTLRFTQESLVEDLGNSVAAPAVSYIDSALEALPAAPLTTESYLVRQNPQRDTARHYLGTVLAGRRAAAIRIIMDALDKGLSVKDVYLNIFQPVQYEIGRLWLTGEASIAQEHFCTACTQLAMSQLYPRILTAEAVHGTFVSTCVGGELHEIGVRMATDLLELDGWDTYYLGANTPARTVVATVQERKPRVLGVSATMTFHLPEVTALISMVREAVGDAVRIVVGGYPFRVSDELWVHVGADACVTNAEDVHQQVLRVANQGAG